MGCTDNWPGGGSERDQLLEQLREKEGNLRRELIFVDRLIDELSRKPEVRRPRRPIKTLGRKQ